MGDKLNPPSKQNLKPPPHPTSPPPPPPSKPNPLMSTNRVVPMYRQRLPQYYLPPKKQRRNCSCCRFLFWLILILFALVFLLAVTGGVIYLLARPYRPNFSVSSLEFVSLNLTNTSRLISLLNLTIVAYNPNTKLNFGYGPISIAASYAGVQLGATSFSGFTQETENSTKLRGVMEGIVDDASDSVAESVKRERFLKMNVEMETKVEGEIWGIKLRDVQLFIYCGGVRAANPMIDGGEAIDTPDKVCKVKFYIQLLNWKF